MLKKAGGLSSASISRYRKWISCRRVASKTQIVGKVFCCASVYLRSSEIASAVLSCPIGAKCKVAPTANSLMIEGVNNCLHGTRGQAVFGEVAVAQAGDKLAGIYHRDGGLLQF